jgi:hypothetical protein
VVEKINLQQFTFCHYIDNYSPWEDIKDIIRKKVSKLRSIAELRAFDGMFYKLHFAVVCGDPLFSSPTVLT